MADPRPALVEMVKRDIARTLRLLPKSGGTDKAWVVTAVSYHDWKRFYSELSFLESEEDPVLLWTQVKKGKDGWELDHWCVVRAVPKGYLRSSTFSTAAFGEAVGPVEELTEQLLLTGSLEE